MNGADCIAWIGRHRAYPSQLLRFRTQSTRTISSTMAITPLLSSPPPLERSLDGSAMDVINDVLLPPDDSIHPHSLMSPHKLFAMDYDKNGGISPVIGPPKRKLGSRDGASADSRSKKTRPSSPPRPPPLSILAAAAVTIASAVNRSISPIHDKRDTLSPMSTVIGNISPLTLRPLKGNLYHAELSKLDTCLALSFGSIRGTVIISNPVILTRTLASNQIFARNVTGCSIISKCRLPVWSTAKRATLVQFFDPIKTRLKTG